MSEVKLRPCPFCGGEAKMYHYKNGWNMWSEVKCTKCGVGQDSIGNGYYNFSEAAEAWNRRYNDL